MTTVSSYALVIGAASMDAKGRTGRRLVPGTSNSGDIRTGLGGVVRNMA